MTPFITIEPVPRKHVDGIVRTIQLPALNQNPTILTLFPPPPTRLPEPKWRKRKAAELRWHLQNLRDSISPTSHETVLEAVDRLTDIPLGVISWIDGTDHQLARHDRGRRQRRRRDLEALARRPPGRSVWPAHKDVGATAVLDCKGMEVCRRVLRPFQDMGVRFCGITFLDVRPAHRERGEGSVRWLLLQRFGEYCEADRLVGYVLALEADVASFEQVGFEEYARVESRFGDLHVMLRVRSKCLSPHL